MKRTTKFLALLLSTVLLLSLLPGTASALVIKDGGYTKLSSIANDYVATQGMCTDGTYIYTFKMPSGNNNLARFYRTTISSGSTSLMKYTDDTSLTNFVELGHGNDMCAIKYNGKTYLYLTTMYHKTHSTFATHSIWKFEVSGGNLKKVAYYDVVSGSTDRNFTAITVYQQTDSTVTLLAANGSTVYKMNIGLTQASGSVSCSKVCNINYDTTISISGAPSFSFRNSSGSSLYEVQGMTYDNGILYYVLTAGSNNTPRSKNYIFAYDLSDLSNTSKREAIASKSIYMTSSTYNYFLEVESIDIYNGTMYFSANAGKSGYYENYDFAGKLNTAFEVTPEYTVTFCNEDGTTLQSVKVKKGNTATYSGSTPKKAYDADNHYTFSKWLSSVGGSAATLTNITQDMKVYAGYTATAHSYTGKVTTEPDCTAEGTKVFTCSCGQSYSEAVSALGHTPVVVNSKDATCTQPGYTGDTVCSVCNASIASGAEISLLPHNEVVDKGYAPTCTSTGLSDGSHCADCGTVLTAQEVLPYAPHTEQIVPGTPAGCLNSGKSDGKICSVCNAVLQAQQVLPRLGHSYSYTNVGDTHTAVCARCSKTLSQNHSYDGGVCVCGAKEAPDPVVDIQIMHTLNLASDISINYAISASALKDYSNFYLRCEIPQYEENVPVGTEVLDIQPELRGNYYYFTLNGIDAVSMTTVIDATLYMEKDGAQYHSNTDLYSVASYAYSQLDKDSATAELKTLCADLLRYGTEAQIFKDYCTDDLADKAMTAVHKSYLSDMDSIAFGTENRVLEDLSNPVVTWAGKSLSLDSKVAVKFIIDASAFSGNAQALSLKISYVDCEGTPLVVTLTDPEVYNAEKNQYSFVFDGLLAAELRSVLSAAVYNGSTRVSATLEYSGAAYGNNKTGQLLKVCKALYAYSDSALDYFR